jgi:PAS domain S-box-containing protein
MKLMGYFLLVTVLIGVVGVIGHLNSNNQENVREYHQYMTIPALTILEKISTEFERMHGSLIMADRNLIQGRKEYSASKNQLFSLIEQYGNLTYSKGSSGEYLAWKEMGDMMLMFSSQMKTSAESYDTAGQELFILYGEKRPLYEIQEKLEFLQTEQQTFKEILERNKGMESAGAKRENAKIQNATQYGRLINNIVILVAIIVSIGLGLFVSYKITKLLSDLARSNKLIIEGKFKEAQNQTFPEKLPPEIQELVETRKKALQELVGKQEIVEINIQLLKATKELENRARFDKKKQLATLSLLEDLNEQKNIISESEEKLKTTLHSIGDAVISTDINSKITYLNPIAEQLTGWKLKEALGKPLLQVFKIINEKTKKPVTNPVKKILKKGVIVGLANHTVLISKSGKHYPIDDSGAPIKDKKQKIIGAVLVFHDVTEERKRQNNLKKAYEELKKLDQLKNVFLSMTSHELKTPITPIKSQSETLLTELTGKLNKSQKESVEMILRNTNHLDGLLSDILDIAKLEANQLQMFPEKTDLKPIFSNIIKDIEQTAHQKNLTISYKIEKLPIIMIDSKRFKQVLLNLLGNSIKYTPPNGKIRVYAKQQNKQIIVSVTDNGMGIAPNMMTKIFDKFVQASPSYKQKQKGTGLGLSVCKGIVTKFGGKIWAESKGLNKGSSFHFTIPIKNKKL